jgi:hypothetical protein
MWCHYTINTSGHAPVARLFYFSGVLIEESNPETKYTKPIRWFLRDGDAATVIRRTQLRISTTDDVPT